MLVEGVLDVGAEGMISRCVTCVITTWIRRVMLYHVLSCHIMSCYIMLYHVMSCHMLPCIVR